MLSRRLIAAFQFAACLLACCNVNGQVPTNELTFKEFCEAHPTPFKWSLDVATADADYDCHDAVRPSSAFVASRRLNAQGNYGSRWTEIRLPWKYWLNTPDRNHRTGKGRLNVGRRGVRTDLAFTITVQQVDFETPHDQLIQSYVTLAQFHGTPSYNSTGNKIGTNAQSTLSIRMDGNTFRGIPHLAARLHGKTDPGAHRSAFETAVDVRFRKLKIGERIRIRQSMLAGLDGSDGWHIGRALMTAEYLDDDPGFQYVVYDHTGPNYMAVKGEPNTANYRPRLGLYTGGVQTQRGQVVDYSDIRGQYAAELEFPYSKSIDF